MNLPNLISLARLLSVPLMVWVILAGKMEFAFWLFIVAGISDAVDGFIAKHFGATSAIGKYLDPLADKALLVSVYVTLGHAGYLPTWLVILVVFRDGDTQPCVLWLTIVIWDVRLPRAFVECVHAGLV